MSCLKAAGAVIAENGCVLFPSRGEELSPESRNVPSALLSTIFIMNQFEAPSLKVGPGFSGCLYKWTVFGTVSVDVSFKPKQGK